jgi:hypothetical protein
MIFASGANYGAAEPFDPHELVSMLLDGLLVRAPSSSPPER